jgi:Flp pilus assembly protein TadG
MVVYNFIRHRGGNVAVMFGLAAFPLVFLVGAGIDYAVSARAQSKLNAVADAAALAAIAPPMMAQSDSGATIAARNMFTGQAASVRGLTIDRLDVDVHSASGGARTVSISYAAQVQNAFGKIYHRDTTKIGGAASASASPAPNIDFYMLLDTSPSMAIAATTEGIQTMVEKTPSQNGCAFACHQSNPAEDKLGNSGEIDNYQLAKTLGVRLRIDNVRDAVKGLTTAAQHTMSGNNAKYRMAIYTFDVSFKTISPLNSNLAGVGTAASDIELLEVYKNNCLYWWRCNDDTDTDYDNAMSNIEPIMPRSGNGTNIAGDMPQEVLFLVTDGVEDAVKDGKRVISTMSSGKCQAIKDKGIRIAVLYTTYYPLPTNPFYMDNIDKWQPDIGPNMQSCASPGLFFEVTTDGDISDAMQKLFEKAVSTAPHLTL